METFENLLGFDPFLTKLISCLDTKAGNETSITLVDVSKQNDITKKAVCIHHMNSNIGCNFYVDDLQNRYTSGESIEHIAEDIFNRSEYDTTFKNNSLLSALVSNLSSYDTVKDNLLIKLLNLKSNDLYLADKVYFPFLESGDSHELAICLSIRVPANDNTLGTIAVTKQLRDKWPVSDADLLKTATDNTSKNLGWKFQNIFEVVSHLLSEEDPFSNYMNPPEPSMYVLTNEAGINGAATLVYPDKLKEISDKFGSNLYIIPSSIHELIVIPDNGMIEADSIREMIKQINRTEVAPTDILSDELFYYSRTTNKVSIANAIMED